MLDSNLFVAALLNSEACRSVLTKWREGAFEVVTSTSLLRELQCTLERPKFSKRISQDDIKELLAFIKATAVIVHPLKLRRRICRDPSDEKVFACALSVGAMVISGDADVLMAESPGVRVMPPRAFLSWLERS